MKNKSVQTKDGTKIKLNENLFGFTTQELKDELELRRINEELRTENSKQLKIIEEAEKVIYEITQRYNKEYLQEDTLLDMSHPRSQESN